jgi:hypothetical protein
MTKMKTQQADPKDYSHITTLAELRAKTRVLRLTVKDQERQLREELKSLPSEAIKSGASRLFSGKQGGGIGWQGALTGIAATAGTALLGSFFAKKATASIAGKAGMGLAKSGLAALAPVLLKLLFRKKKAAS